MLNNKFNLGFYPTPVYKLNNLSKLHSVYNIYIKRDDNTGLASGGNKTRKLEYLIKQAVDEKYDTVITAGAQQSNHCRQTTAACAAAGLKCHLLLGGDKPDKYTGNLLLSALLGATIHFAGQNRKGEDIESLKNKLDKNGSKCYMVPYGGSNITGALGYVNAVKELKQQIAAMNLNLDYIFFASSSGGTQAGITLGLELFNLKTKLVPIQIDKHETYGKTLEQIVLSLVNEGVNLFKIKKEFHITDIYVNKDYNKADYGVLTENEKLAINTLAETEGILLDPVYTGRAFYGMLDMLKQQKIEKKSNIMFWHTGGLPALFKYSDELI
jgi:D-cysteine desulfhydrase